jgi:hypothetical protein
MDYIYIRESGALKLYVHQVQKYDAKCSQVRLQLPCAQIRNMEL